MKKIRIAVFGISEGIFYALQNEINYLKAEIVLFLDNDKTKQGISYMNVPIEAPSRSLLDRYAVDAYLITALSAYEDIREQLIDLGVRREAIHVFAVEGILQYCLGTISDIDTDFVKNAYIQPVKILEVVSRYNAMYEEYSKIQRMTAGGWYDKGNFISHALGGIVNGRMVSYSNSSEALQYSVDKKFRLLECDMMLVGGNDLILAHEYTDLYRAQLEQYSVMTAEEWMRRIMENPDTSCLVDVKWDEYDQYEFVIGEIDRLIASLADGESEKNKLKEQIVLEVYDETTIQLAKARNFNMFFTQYRNPEWQYLMNTVNLCARYGIRAVGLGTDQCFDREKFIKILADKGIKIFVFSTNSIDEYSTLMKMGITGVFTDYMANSEAD